MNETDLPDRTKSTIPGIRKTYRVIFAILQAVMALELVLLIANDRWLHAFLVIGTMTAFLFPFAIRRGREPLIPIGVQVCIALFVFASLFLGEVRDYYERIWWWDLALHGSAGLLLGFLGFLIVYILHADKAVDLHMKPSFLALFAFFFAIGIGAGWEIFEFGMDKLFGLTMQKPMWDDPSGLTDTIWDLILNGIGAGLVSLTGWRYIRRTPRMIVGKRTRRFLAKHHLLRDRK